MAGGSRTVLVHGREDSWISGGAGSVVDLRTRRRVMKRLELDAEVGKIAPVLITAFLPVEHEALNNGRTVPLGTNNCVQDETRSGGIVRTSDENTYGSTSWLLGFRTKK